jgi:hypothetical protein
MKNIYSVFLELAEKMNGQPIGGQLAKDIIWLISLLFGFWLLVLLALSPFLVLKLIFEKRERK